MRNKVLHLFSNTLFVLNMYRLFGLFVLLFTFNYTMQNTSKDPKNWAKLNPSEYEIIVNKGTERPFSGSYENHFEKGLYACKRCHAPLYESKDKFKTHCGWPSFDQEIKGAVTQKPDSDGQRTEIICTNCGAHLGHVFTGEYLSPKNVRHCVNSISMVFLPASSPDLIIETKKAYFASGCYWGTEYWMAKAVGVLHTKVGYMGGKSYPNLTYDLVSTGTTGHVETVEVIFDPAKITYDDLVKLFFETHDPSQKNGQGPDIGSQYLSKIFYIDEEQQIIAQKYSDILKEKGLKVATLIQSAGVFYGEKMDYHQKYYTKTGKTPYCHFYTKRF